MKSQYDPSKAMKKYLRAIKRATNCSSARSAKIMKQLKTDILLYEEENGTVDESTVALRFGAPEDVARSLMDETDTEEVNRSLKRGRRMALAALIAAVTAVLTAVVAFGIHIANYVNQEAYRNGYYVEKIYTESEHEAMGDGGYHAVEAIQPVATTQSGQISGYKYVTYYSGTGEEVWRLELHGCFTYDGSSSTATSSTATVYPYSASAVTINDRSYISGSAAYGSAVVNYLGNITSKPVRLACDKNGNLF